MILKEKGLTYETVEVPKEKESRTELVSVSGQLLVPVLVDGDKVICDSTYIANYLEEKY